ncbi:MAG: 8-oxoguanine deaminase, partial [Planctomycetota bacterium]
MSALLLIRDLSLAGPDGRAARGDLALRGDRIVTAGAVRDAESPADLVVDGEGCTAYPGLINAHEHLVGTWSPRTGWGPHDNVYGWLDRYMVHGVRQERIRV